MSDDSSLQSLASRIDALERQSRRLKIMLFAALVLVLSLGAAAGTIAQQKSLSFHDSTGTVKLSSDGLYLYNKAGVPLMALYISNTGEPVIRMKDANNKARIFFGLTGGHTPRVQFNDASENQRLYVGLTTEQTGQFQTFDTAGNKQTSMDDDQIRVGDDNGKQRIYLGISDSNDTFMRMYNPDGTVRIYTGIFTDGKAGFASYDSAGTNTWSEP